MDKVFRINSQQSENITSTQNLLDFHIPSGEVYDLSKSHVAVRVKPTTATTAPDANTTTAIFNTDVVFNNANSAAPDNGSYVSSVAIVKNAHMNSERAGRIEELRDVNKLRLYQKSTEKNEEDEMKDQTFNLMGCRDAEAFGSISPLIQATAEDQTDNTGEASKVLEKEVRIPLKDILNVGNAKMFDTNRLGRCHLNLELDIDRLSANNDNFDQDFYTTNNNGACDDDADGGEKTSLTLSKVYNMDYQEHLPFYVGMPVEWKEGTLGGNPVAANTRREITNIQINTANGKVTLTFKSSWGAGATANVKIGPVDSGDLTSSFTMNQAQIVLHAVGRDKLGPMPDKIEFTKYSLEKDNANGRTAFRRNYEVEPDCVNMLVLLPKVSEGKLSDLVFEDFRVSVDNELLTNRNVFKDTQLYYDRLERYMKNQGKPLKNMLGKEYDNKIVNAGNAESSNGQENLIHAISEPMPVTQNMKLVELEINAAAGVQDVLLYKEINVAV